MFPSDSQSFGAVPFRQPFPHLLAIGSLLVCTGVFTLSAKPIRADTFNIEIDFMVETGSAPHSHQPTTAEVDAIVQMFACRGHILNIDVDDQIPHHDVLVRDPQNAGDFFGYDGAANSFGNLKALWFDHADESGWHYCIFGHQYENELYQPSGSSGIGEVCGDDFMVSLGTFAGETGTPFEKAATLAHEFGHNLGLQHCGDMDCDLTGDHVENLPSIMSYFYQLTGVRSNLICHGLTPAHGTLFKEFDYSRGRMCTLTELALDEDFGAGMVPVDWDCDGAVGGVVIQDLDGNDNGWCGASGALSTLSDYNEWANIQDCTRFMTRGELDNRPTVSCITAEEAHALDARHGCPQAQVTTESCAAGKMYYLAVDGFDAWLGGTCEAPFRTLYWSHDVILEESVLFINSGTYEAGGVLSKPMTIHAVGTVRIE